MKIITPSLQLYGSLEFAYEFFNTELFGGTLPPVVITLNCKRLSSKGYFIAKNYKERKSRRHSGEIALNPRWFDDSLEGILANFVHQMMHVWQHQASSASRAGYHNRIWSEQMKNIGLYPSSTGKPGGLEVGQQVGQYVIQKGRFDKACRKLLKAGFDVRWTEALADKKAKRSSTSKSPVGRISWRCPSCGLNAWAKPSANLVCGDCNEDLLPR